MRLVFHVPDKYPINPGGASNGNQGNIVGFSNYIHRMDTINDIAAEKIGAGAAANVAASIFLSSIILYI